ncbi:hypothetical protein [Actinomyces marmotae]|uniref:hypothetical protein n=1 Tax=Actinomyces marmotae TaxID=2737173 RepID=UPI00135B81DB|nr:hypothetical protein [Actinomyces marmotae]
MQMLLLGAIVLLSYPVIAMTLWTVRRKPIVGAVLIAGSLALMGIWMTVNVGLFIPPAAGVCMLVCLALASDFSWRLTPGDILICAGFALVAISLAAGASLNTVLGELILDAAPAYLAGRMLVERIGLRDFATAVAAIWLIAAALGYFEAITRINPFVLIEFPTRAYADWASIQIRAGLPRIEGAFGHSIVFGVSMAAGIPMVAIARWPSWARIAGMMALVGVTLPSLSRAGIIGAVIALVLSLTIMRTDITPSWRSATLIALGAGIFIATPVLLDVFAQAGDEQEGSAEYRGQLLILVKRLVLIGASPARVVRNGTVYWEGFRSIDDQVLLAALRYGWAPVIPFLIGALYVVLRVMGGRGNAAQVAIASMIPAFVSVAFITQLSTVVWVIAGASVAASAAEREGRDDAAGLPSRRSGPGQTDDGQRAQAPPGAGGAVAGSPNGGPAPVAVPSGAVAGPEGLMMSSADLARFRLPPNPESR